MGLWGLVDDSRMVSVSRLVDIYEVDTILHLSVYPELPLCPE